MLTFAWILLTIFAIIFLALVRSAWIARRRYLNALHKSNNATTHVEHIRPTRFYGGGRPINLIYTSAQFSQAAEISHILAASSTATDMANNLIAAASNSSSAEIASRGMRNVLISESSSL
ncbi:hypothetical protein [Polaromonas sp. CF318]|uniref:hypothetical protein n=1 Tax=Polaromonas sp. CF318 TaxID=1144318 RepID=UPI0012FCA0CF|nr:hypothetical protein [Polaromonas sp. CF318]